MCIPPNRDEVTCWPEQRRDRTPAESSSTTDVLPHRVTKRSFHRESAPPAKERRERLAPSHQRAQHALDLVARVDTRPGKG